MYSSLTSTSHHLTTSSADEVLEELLGPGCGSDAISGTAVQGLNALSFLFAINHGQALYRHGGEGGQGIHRTLSRVSHLRYEGHS